MVDEKSRKRLISIVTPCFNEVDNIIPCYEAVKSLFENELPDYELEHIFCDNNSTDGTQDILKDLADSNPEIKVIFNSRNFGALRNLFNGLRHTKGDAVIPMLSADLQDPPEVILEFIPLWEDGHEVVYGVRAERDENFLLTLMRKVFYQVVNRWSPFEIPVDVGEFQLIDRVVVDELCQFEDFHPYLRGMIAYCGFRTIGVRYTWKRRVRGKSKSNFASLIDQGLNGIISFSTVPTRLALAAGFVISILSLLTAVVFLIINLIYFRELSPPGIPLLTVALFFFSGIQLLFIGLMGEYLLAIHSQVRKRPMVIERETINIETRASK
ncbi:MAG: glycosyltransferase family 2 protein [Proteobacteria bacterium]|nr:glycosyltransferase family 2 protein [Pseudomonadota bacterium]